ncbi:hypothetical protein KDN32_05745 [Nocardioides sp. J2M5]|uniref:hypothetical protein n=1 Tax=Nocardioides palaemonis TaxID=2829810 RepID=UPI001BA864D7|nr:hypothetical protein [Nocardioides palaemonis]MBS2937238.1 hypothetical protein [Nocardioides palaemonis]
MPHMLMSTSRRGSAISWLALTALLPIVSACGEEEAGTSVHDFMESTSEVNTLALSDIYDHDVSGVVIVCAYTGAKAIRDELGFRWRGAAGLADKLDSTDTHQAIIAVHEDDVVESEVVPIDVLHLCDMDLSYPATIDAGTTLRIAWSSVPWSDGTEKRIPVASIQ